MSSTTSSPAPSATSSSCASINFSVFPTSDVACAVGSTSGIPSNYADTLKSCCKSAPVEKFNGSDCGLYCLSVEQSVADLQKCFQDGGVNAALIFCNSNNTATATGKPSSTSSGGSGTSKSSSPSGTTSGGATSSSTGAAAVVGVPTQGVSKAGLGMVAMLAVSAVFGALL